MLDKFLKADYDKYTENRKRDIKTYLIEETFDYDDVEISLYLNIFNGQDIDTIGIEYEDKSNDSNYVYNTTNFDFDIKQLKKDFFREVNDEDYDENINEEYMEEFFKKIEPRFLNFQLNETLSKNNQTESKKLKI